MDKDEILARSRKENNDQDLVELESYAAAGRIAVTVGTLVCCLLAILHVIFRETINCGIWTVYFSMLSATMAVKYIKLRKRHELVISLLYGVCCVMFFWLYLRDLLGVG